MQLERAPGALKPSEYDPVQLIGATARPACGAGLLYRCLGAPNLALVAAVVNPDCAHPAQVGAHKSTGRRDLQRSGSAECMLRWLRGRKECSSEWKIDAAGNIEKFRTCG